MIDDLGVPTAARQLDPVVEEMLSQNDRGCAIAAGAHLEEQLTKAILDQWPPLSRGTRDRLFAVNGPMATHSARISLAHAMAILSNNARRDFDRVRLIRNHAAHVGTEFAFNLPAIRKHVDNLHVSEFMPPDDYRQSELRNRFTAAVKCLSVYLFFQAEFKRRFGIHQIMPLFGTEEGKYVPPPPGGFPRRPW